MSEIKVTKNKTANWQEYIKNYYESHKEERLQAMKDYKQKNQAKITEYNKNYYHLNKNKYKVNKTCDVCNCEISSSNFSKHIKSKKHQLNLQE